MERKITYGLIIIVVIYLFRQCSVFDDYKNFVKSREFERMLEIKQREDFVKQTKQKIKADSILKVALQAEVKAHEKTITELKKKNERITNDYTNNRAEVITQIENGDCDTSEIKILIKSCDTALNAKDQVIAAQDTLIQKQKQELQIDSSLISSHLIIANNLGKENQELKKQVKKEKRKAFIHKAALVAVIVAENILIINLRK